MPASGITAQKDYTVKNIPKRLTLKVETIRQLSATDLANVAGGLPAGTSSESPFMCMSYNTVCGGCYSDYGCTAFCQQ